MIAKRKFFSDREYHLSISHVPGEYQECINHVSPMVVNATPTVSAIAVNSMSAFKMLATIVLVGLHAATQLYGQAPAADTTRVDNWYAASKKFWGTNQDSARFYLDQMMTYSKDVNYDRGVAYSLYGYGVTEGVLYKQFQYFTQSLALFEALHDKFGIGLNLIKIGFIYQLIGQREKAIDYYLQSLKVKKAVDDYGGIALALINLGNNYEWQHEYEKALKYYEESLIYRLKAGTRQGIAYSQTNIGRVMLELDQADQALVMADSAISNFATTTDLSGQIMVLNVRGQALKKLGRLDEAEKTFESIVRYPSRFQFQNEALNAKKELIAFYTRRGDIRKAFDLQSNYIVTRDTLSNSDYRAETQRLVNEFEFKNQEQKALQEKAVAEQKVSRRNNLEYLSITVVVLILFVLLFSGRRKIPGAMANAVLLISLLLLFEFLLVLTDSPVEQITGGDPALKLLANLLLALLILPAHKFLETFIQRKFFTRTTSESQPTN